MLKNSSLLFFIELIFESTEALLINMSGVLPNFSLITFKDFFISLSLVISILRKVIEFLYSES